MDARRLSLRAIPPVATVAVVALGAATALGATPKPGSHYQVFEHGGLAIQLINISVGDDHQIAGIFANDPNCQTEDGNYQGFGLAKTVRVKHGAFSYRGKADSTIYGTGPRQVKVRIDGEFTAAKKAKGSYSIKGCPDEVRFKTRWTLGG